MVKVVRMTMVKWHLQKEVNVKDKADESYREVDATEAY